MDVLEAIKTRRSVRKWLPKPAPEELVEQILEAGRWAPSAGNFQPWADSPREVAEQSQVVFAIVTDAAAVRAIALGPDGVISGLSKAAVFLDMSAIAPHESRAISTEFKTPDEQC